MKITVGLEVGEMGTPIEMANALIKYYMRGITDDSTYNIQRSELAEVAEHIQVYLKHNEVKSGE